MTRPHRCRLCGHRPRRVVSATRQTAGKTAANLVELGRIVQRRDGRWACWNVDH